MKIALNPLQAEKLREAHSVLQQAQTILTERFAMLCAEHEIRDATLVSLEGNIMTISTPEGDGAA